MTARVTAIYQGGVLRPMTPLPFAEGQQVLVALAEETPRSNVPPEVIERIRSAKSWEAFIAAAEEASSHQPDDEYDFLESLNANRRRVGARLLFDPERKGIDW